MDSKGNFFNLHNNSSSLNPGAYITHNATSPLSDITGGNLSDYMQLPLEPQKALYCFFSYMQQCSPRPVNAL